MYHAKRIGGDRIEVFKPSMRARKTDRLTLESDLRRALERDEITILYQPIVRLEDRSIAGFEALVRWDHPEDWAASRRRNSSPSRRRSGSSSTSACSCSSAPRASSAPGSAPRATATPIFASVNVSSRQLLRQDLIHDLRTVIARVRPGARHAQARTHRVAGDGEPRTCCADASPHPRARRRALRSTISAPAIPRSSYLQRFPFDTIKIDQSFVRKIEQGHAPGDPALDHRARARSRHGGGRRGRGNAIPTRSSFISSAANTRRAMPSASR